MREQPSGHQRRGEKHNDQQRIGCAPPYGEAVEEWWIAGDFTADRAACLAELERLARVS